MTNSWHGADTASNFPMNPTPASLCSAGAGLSGTFDEFSCKTNPLGVKGVGEIGSVGAPPVVVNAIIDALRPWGVDHVDMPVTPARIRERARQG